MQELVVHLLEAHDFAGQRLAEVQLLAQQSDAAVVAHAAQSELARVLEFGQLRRVAFLRGLVDGGWCLVAQRLMRPIDVEVEPEGVEATLLCF